MAIPKVFLILILLFCIFSSCNSTSEIRTEEFIIKKTKSEKAVMFLFPCFSCDAEHTLAEANFIDEVIQNNISVVVVNENQKLFLNDEDLKRIERTINQCVESYELTTDNVVIGGFSSGGNIALQISSYLKMNSPVKPKFIFLVDSPIDLIQVYKNAQHDIDLNYHTDAINEGKFIVKYLLDNLGERDIDFKNYKKYSPYLSGEKNQPNLDNLSDVQIRLYAEPNVIWQQSHRGRSYEFLNSFQLENLNKYLEKMEKVETEFIRTQNKGFKANGEYHPHSWNLVDGADISSWILK